MPGEYKIGKYILNQYITDGKSAGIFENLRQKLAIVDNKIW